MNRRLFSPLGAALLLAQCTPAGCEPPGPATPPPTTTPVPATLVPDRGYRLCIDFDGATVTQDFPGGTQVTFALADSGLPPDVQAGVIDYARRKLQPWSIQIISGECERNALTQIMHVTPSPAPEQAQIAAGSNGYAMISGWGVPHLDDGFIFTSTMATTHIKATVVHEAGHAAGLSHPLNWERSIMGDGSDDSLDWSEGDKVKLTARFSS